MRPPASHVVNVLVAIGVHDAGTLAARNKAGRTADTAKGADGRVHSAGNRFLRADEEIF